MLISKFLHFSGRQRVLQYNICPYNSNNEELYNVVND